jgi:hypothetical protein
LQEAPRIIRARFTVALEQAFATSFTSGLSTRPWRRTVFQDRSMRHARKDSMSAGVTAATGSAASGLRAMEFR